MSLVRMEKPERLSSTSNQGGAASIVLYLSWLTFISSQFFSALKWMYVFALVLSIAVFLKALVNNQYHIKKFFLLPLIFILSFLPSVFYAQYDKIWAFSQFFSLVIRAAPFLFLVGAIASDEFIEKSTIRIFWWTLCVYCAWLVLGQHWVLEGGSLENVGASVIIATLPFVIVRRGALVGVVAIPLLLLSDSRMGGALALYTFAMCYFLRMLPKKLAPIFATIVTALTAVVIVVLNAEVFLPDSAPLVADYGNDNVRKAMQYYSIAAIKESPFLGIGMGQVNSMMELYWGEEILAHGFLSYIWAQSGLIPLLIFFLVTFLSVYRPAKLYMREGDRVMLALAISNMTAFLFFLTRPQQSGPMYFLFLFWGLGSLYFQKKTNQHQRALLYEGIT